MRTVSFSEIWTHQRCQWRWGLTYGQGIKPKVPDQPLAFGGLVHLMLAQFYMRKGRISMADVRRAITKRGNPPPTVEDEEKAQAMMEAYAEEYVADLKGARALKILAVEWPFRTRMLTRDGGFSNYELIGVIDLIVRDDRGYIWPWDHKTATSFPAAPHIALDAQMATYSWGLMRLGVPIGGVVMNLLKKTKTPQFERHRIIKMPPELESWGRNLYETALQIPYDIHAPPPQEELPRTPDKRCAWDCPLAKPCLLDLEQEFEAYNHVLETDFVRRKGGRDRGWLKKYNTKVPKAWTKPPAKKGRK